MLIKNNPHLQALNIMQIHSPEAAILSTLIFNAIVIPAPIPFIIKKGSSLNWSHLRKNVVT
jgi:potassium-transporting ATPase ATP-binding subunit